MRLRSAKRRSALFTKENSEDAQSRDGGRRETQSLSNGASPVIREQGGCAGLGGRPSASTDSVEWGECCKNGEKEGRGRHGGAQEGYDCGSVSRPLGDHRDIGEECPSATRGGARDRLLRELKWVAGRARGDQTETRCFKAAILRGVGSAEESASCSFLSRMQGERNGGRRVLCEG